MNLIILSHMYPTEYAPYLGIFVEEQVQALKRLIQGKITVISPVPWSPRFLWFRKKWRDYGRIARVISRNEIRIHHSRFLVIPRMFLHSVQGICMYLSTRTLVGRLVGEDRRVTVIHAHRVLPEGLAAVLLKKELHVKVVCTAHGSDINVHASRSKVSCALARYVLRNADALVAVSDNLKKQMCRIAARSDIRVVTNGVNAETTARDSVADDGCARRGNGKNILFVGTLCYEKGVRELLEAFALLRREMSDVKLILVGDNRIPKWIDTFLEENCLDGAVNIPGAVSHEEVNRYYALASVFVLPSYREGMPTVMFEAMASKLPVIISRVGGVEEVIRDGVNGILVEPHSVQDLFDKLKLVIEDGDLREFVSDNAFKDVVTRYTWNHNAIRMNDIYEEVLKNGDTA